MNMEEWQRKLKAEKDAARQKKTESAEILHGYRGDLKDDELKLKAIREEERKKALDAQQILHNYKGSQLPEGVKTKEQRTEQHFPTPVNAGQGPHRDGVLDVIVQGSVSERAAALVAAAAADGASSIPIPSASSSTHSISRNPAISDPSTVTASEGKANGTVLADDDDDDDDDDDFGPSLQSNSSGYNPTTLGQPPSDVMNHSMALTTMTVAPSAEIEPKPSTPIEESVMVEKPPEAFMSNGTTASASETTSTEEIIPTPQQPLQRMDILLAFGLVTISSPPNLESYMTAVQTIAANAIQESNEEGAIMDPNYPPYVKDTKWDSTFTSLRNLLLHLHSQMSPYLAIANRLTSACFCNSI